MLPIRGHRGRQPGVPRNNRLVHGQNGLRVDTEPGDLKPVSSLIRSELNRWLSISYVLSIKPIILFLSGTHILKAKNILGLA